MWQMKFLTYKEKMDQATREAKATVVALVVTITAWIVLGFGLSGLDITLFHLPLWVWGGTLGIYIVSIIVVVVLRLFVFEDFDLDSEDFEPAYADEAHATAAQPAPEPHATAARPAPAQTPGEACNE